MAVKTRKPMVDKRATESLIKEGNAIISRFMKAHYTKPHKDVRYLLPIYKKCVEKIEKSKSIQYSSMLWVVKQLSQISTLSEALCLSAKTGNPIPLWIAIVRNIKWLNDKQK